MTTFTYVQSVYSRGVLDPRLWARSNIEDFQKGARTLDNVVVIPQGGINKRFGTDYIAEIEGPSTYDEILLDILKYIDNSIDVLVFLDQKVEVYKNDSFYKEVLSPYTSTNLPNIKTTQTHDTLITVHPDIPIHRFFYSDDVNDYKFIPIDFVHQPTADFSDNFFHAQFTLSSPDIGDGRTITITGTTEYPAIIDQRDMINNTPAAPGGGDRYIHDGDDGTLLGVSIKTGDILEYNAVGPTWDRSPDGTSTNTAPANNGIVYDNARLAYYIFNSTSKLWRYYGTALFQFSEDYLDGLFVAGEGTMRLTDYVSTTVMQGTIIESFGTTTVFPGQSAALTQPVFSASKGYPRAVGFFQNRLWFGGTKTLPTGVFGSKEGQANYYNFDNSSGQGNSAISLYVNTGESDVVRDILGAKNLFVFTVEGVSVSINIDDSGMTPSNSALTEETSSGISNLPAVYFDNQVIFSDYGGKIIHSMTYDVQSQGYQDNDISILSQHLIKTPISMDILKNPTTDNGTFLLVINADGTLAIFTSLLNEDVKAWTYGYTNGPNSTLDYFRHVASSHDQVYFITERSINGQTKFYLEKLNFDRNLDCAIDFSSVSPTNIITGLSHLEGREVSVIGDGYYLGDFTVSAGQITLNTEISNAEIGIFFAPIVSPLPISAEGPTGTIFYDPKTIHSLIIDYYETLGLTLNDYPIPNLIADVTQFDTTPVLRSGFIKEQPMSGWDVYQENTISQNAPFPFLIRAMGAEVEI